MRRSLRFVIGVFGAVAVCKSASAQVVGGTTADKAERVRVSLEQQGTVGFALLILRAQVDSIHVQDRRAVLAVLESFVLQNWRSPGRYEAVNAAVMTISAASNTSGPGTPFPQAAVALRRIALETGDGFDGTAAAGLEYAADLEVAIEALEEIAISKQFAATAALNALSNLSDPRAVAALTRLCRARLESEAARRTLRGVARRRGLAGRNCDER